MNSIGLKYKIRKPTISTIMIAMIILIAQLIHQLPLNREVIGVSKM